MTYHDRELYDVKWGSIKDKTSKTESRRPRVQIISPQKMLIDIQAVLNAIPESAMTVVELQESIQKILDGEV